ncbi:MAG: hypothetical protein ABJF50_15690 [Paracoccaceae bacterium]
MTFLKPIAYTALLAITSFASTASAQSVASIVQAANFFENGQATNGAMMTVDVKGPVTISDAVELPGFAFAVYDVDATPNSITLKLIAQLEKLQITLYDSTTFDRYYFAFDEAITSAEIADTTDENFSATVEVIAPGTTVSSAGAFMDGLPTDFTFENGGILITVGEGTDLTKITENGGALTVNF